MTTFDLEHAERLAAEHSSGVGLTYQVADQLQLACARIRDLETGQAEEHASVARLRGDAFAALNGCLVAQRSKYAAVAKAIESLADRVRQLEAVIRAAASSLDGDASEYDAEKVRLALLEGVRS